MAKERVLILDICPLSVWYSERDNFIGMEMIAEYILLQEHFEERGYPGYCAVQGEFTVYPEGWRSRHVSIHGALIKRFTKPDWEV